MNQEQGINLKIIKNILTSELVKNISATIEWALINSLSDGDIIVVILILYCQIFYGISSHCEKDFKDKPVCQPTLLLFLQFLCLMWINFINTWPGSGNDGVGFIYVMLASLRLFLFVCN